MVHVAPSLNLHQQLIPSQALYQQDILEKKDVQKEQRKRPPLKGKEKSQEEEAEAKPAREHNMPSPGRERLNVFPGNEQDVLPEVIKVIYVGCLCYLIKSSVSCSSEVSVCSVIT